jgi:AcrR family transcriptional regulator
MPRAASARRRIASEPRDLRARGRNTRRKLLDAGARVFAAKGYHATRVDDIVKLARTSHGTFYLYFPNKEDLFRALADEVRQEMQALAESLGPLHPGPQGREELQSWIAKFVDLYEQHGAVIRVWTEAEIGGSEFGRLGTELLTEFTRVLIRRITAASPPDLDPTVAALALVAMLERLNYYAVSEQVPIDRETMTDTLARVTHAALFGC